MPRLVPPLFIVTLLVVLALPAAGHGADLRNGSVGAFTHAECGGGTSTRPTQLQPPDDGGRVTQVAGVTSLEFILDGKAFIRGPGLLNGFEASATGPGNCGADNFISFDLKPGEGATIRLDGFAFFYEAGDILAPRWTPGQTTITPPRNGPGQVMNDVKFSEDKKTLSFVAPNGGGWVIRSFRSSNPSLRIKMVAAPNALDFTRLALPRYGADANGDGRTDAYPPDGTLSVAGPFPQRLTVDPCPTTITVSWSLDGSPIGQGCSVVANPTTLGEHAISVRTTSKGGLVDLGATTRTIDVKDKLIVSLGDSVASGEGASQVAGPLGWGNKQCHRSGGAGPSEAAKLLENADPTSSVTFINLACSGATITQGLIGAYDGIEPLQGPLLQPQVFRMRTLLGDRDPDAVTVSIGANDVEFSAIVKDCAKPISGNDCGAPNTGAGEVRFNRLTPALPGRYDQLAQALTAEAVPADRVFLDEYFDPTRSDDGTTFCSGLAFLSLEAREAQWASEVMLTQLNTIGTAAARRNGWNRPTGTFAEFKQHGYCANDRWITRIGESVTRQQDEFGALHPNLTGHRASYGPMIARAVGPKVGVPLGATGVPSVKVRRAGSAVTLDVDWVAWNGWKSLRSIDVRLTDRDGLLGTLRLDPRKGTIRMTGRDGRTVATRVRARRGASSGKLRLAADRARVTRRAKGAEFRLPLRLQPGAARGYVEIRAGATALSGKTQSAVPIGGFTVSR